MKKNKINVFEHVLNNKSSIQFKCTIPLCIDGDFGFYMDSVF